MLYHRIGCPLEDAGDDPRSRVEDCPPEMLGLYHAGYIDFDHMSDVKQYRWGYDRMMNLPDATIRWLDEQGRKAEKRGGPDRRYAQLEPYPPAVDEGMRAAFEKRMQLLASEPHPIDAEHRPDSPPRNPDGRLVTITRVNRGS
jgi:hypothetical protein